MARTNDARARALIAQEAARIILEEGVDDFGLAKRKAAERLGVAQSGALPSNAQIESCLAERQRLFEAGTHEDRLRELREVAVELMESMVAFAPRLAGPVLTGTATINSVIEVHLFSESIEAVADTLATRGYSAAHYDKKYRFGGGRTSILPGFRVQVRGEVAVMPVFPENGVREAPLSSIDQRPMQRASLRSVTALLRAP